MYIQDIYGIVNNQGIHHDVSRTERGAKRYASLNGYAKVSIRQGGGYNPIIFAEKVNGKWKNI